MAYSFDEIVDKTGIHAIKTGVLKARYGREDLIPLWVADMDFRTPDFILDALKERLEHPIFGYTIIDDEYFQSIIDWVKYKHSWDIERKHLSFVPGVVSGIACCVNAFTKPGDKIIIQPPVYHPFRMIIEENGRQLVNNQLKLVDGKYRMDFEHLRTVIDKDCKMLILCNPHNPGGIVWDRETLEELAEICADNDILVISDEIHADLVYEGSQHIPFATVSEKALHNSITFMAPSKTFNIAGIVSSYTITIDEHIRKKLHSYLDANSMGHGTLFSYIASTAAYKNGKDWLKELMLYLDGNVKFVDEYLKKNIPQIKAYIPEASFLVWLDCRELKLSQKELASLFVDKARLALNEGVTFGPGGEGFMRLNIGTSREVLEKAMAQLKEAVL